MAGYVLTRALPGGFLDDHGDVGNWRCSLGIAALSVEALIILLAAGWAWHARGPHHQLGREDPVRRVPPSRVQPLPLTSLPPH